MSAKSMKDITERMKEMRFRKKWFGGVDESDVWRQLEELQADYQSVYDIQKECSQVLLKERDKEIARLKRHISRLQSAGGEPRE